ncbi:MAG: hypothetical protein QM668_13170 [Agriterribacter sp.]
MKRFFCLPALLCFYAGAAFAYNNHITEPDTNSYSLTGLELTNINNHPVSKIHFHAAYIHHRLLHTYANWHLQSFTTDTAAIPGEHKPLNNTAMNTQKKTERRFNPDSSLSAIAGDAANGVLKTSFTLTGYLEGFSTVTGYSEKYGSVKRYAVNSPLLSLYAIAFPAIADMPANRIVYDVKDRYTIIPDYAAWDAWKQHHSYCFEFTAPASLVDQVPEMIKTALDNYFRLTTGFMEMDMPCLELHATVAFKNIPKATRQYANMLGQVAGMQELYGSSQELCDFLDVRLPIPVINGMACELLDISLSDEPVTIEKLREWLMPYGLELVTAIKRMKVFYMSDGH